MANVLIIEDDQALRESLAETLREFGHRAIEAASGRLGLDISTRERIDAVLLDLRMPGMDGLEVLRRLRADRVETPPVAILTAYATSANTIEAMRLGAFDHLTKPIGRDDLFSLISRMLATRASSDHVPAPLAAGDDELIGPSAAMRSVEKTIGLVADSDATVLITGETGTGKEIVARAVHRHGRRSAGPFIAVNCAAIPAELLESELFGHARGAFTGAIAERRGAFRDADKGTLFLDEIGDMDIAVQAKILRALQERIVTPVGGRAVRVDVRVLAATNKDLPTAVQTGRFREDLFYRLNVVPIHLPPLRERLADILPLAEHFLRQATAPPKRLASDAAARLLAYSWPGNIRELKNAVERVAILCRGDAIASSDFDFLATKSSAHSGALDFAQGDLPTAISRLERYMITRALQEADGNRTEAARRLGIHRQLLYSKAQKFGIDIGEASEYQTGAVAKPDKPR
ncbi:sigma-54 dependent transcriptional regulator (plasmid) [Methylocystis sp. MJC1]|uniref:sigma-54-dependent transcriptional regulator n=1 Tax=Methylocystis sp. MJC1 TaxID=2654282 RepID=UPI0013EAA99F|nr:sigma-54 dependent transcriptional regulator [Methylocystis sp. MJC1]KAF2991405.1 Transcriptional regulatory protein ZraR [Methylocystis sp. MJC1]MBU6529481.1 sigma-54-dependent Fis family transcriptional regulator [Methylocystis sp. MJC1]UZX14253.1 sigma-54 dependent transcriptional regulator [Methylocystis sp. MJC1]